MSDDTTNDAATAREEVAQTEPAKAPLPDPAGLAHSLSPVDLPEPAEPLVNPLRWTVTVMATAGLFLALFNAEAIRGWAYAMEPTPVTEPVMVRAEQWYDATATVGLQHPASIMRGWWKAAQAARFPGQADAETETGPETEVPEPAQN